MAEKSSKGLERVRIQLSARAAGPSARAARDASGGQGSEIHEGWREELESATREVFEIMAGAWLEKPPAESEPFVTDFTAMVGIAGNLCGLVGLHTSAECARRIAAKMLGTEDAGGDAQDAFGEVCNMIAGSFKARIAGLADGCGLSVPTVIFGRDFNLFSLARGEHYEVIFTFEGKPLLVTLDVHD